MTAAWLGAALLAGLGMLAAELRGWGRPPRPAWRWTLAAPFCAAHRGGSALQPENTLAAFETAAAGHGCAFLELDVHASADGVPVVIHDPTVNRTTGGRGAVSAMTLAELRTLDAGARFVPPEGRSAAAPSCPIPTLEEVLRRLPQCWFSIDIKQDRPPCERAVVDVVRRTGMQGRVLLGSDAHRRFRRIQAAGPELASFFTRRAAGVFLLAVWLGLSRAYRPPHHTLQVPERLGRLRVVTGRFVRAAHALGIPVIVWTVNEEADMRRLLALGVDGIMTDRPDVFNRVARKAMVPKGIGPQ